MKVTDIKKGDTLVFHPRSITRKNSNGKTTGVIKMIERLKESSLKKQFEAVTVIRKKLNIDQTTFMNEFDFDKLYLSKYGEIYYFVDTRYNNPIYFHDETFEIVNY